MITDEIIIRCLQGKATAEERALLASWRKEAPENERRYLEMERLWELTGMASPEHVPLPSGELAGRLIGRAEAELAQERKEGVLPLQPPAGARPRSGSRLLLTRIGGGLLAAAVAGLSFLAGVQYRTAPGPDSDLGLNEVTTGEGEMTTLTLADGTAVRLGPNSRIWVVQGGSNPIIGLEGRGYFGVVPNPDRQFTVRTAHGDAMALGTRFEVRSDAEEFRVLVLEGNVRVSAGGGSLEIGEGVMSRSEAGEPPSTTVVPDVYEQLEWVGSALVFRATPLARVAAEIERYYGVPIEIDNEDLGRMTVTATFIDQGVDEVMYVVCRIVGAECVLEDGRYRVGGQSLGATREEPRV